MLRKSALRVHWSFLSVLMMVALASCDVPKDPEEERQPLGDFRLGYAIVSATNATPLITSRSATAEEIELALKSAIQDWFGDYRGNNFYHIAVAVDSYNLGAPGIPVIASPKSAMGVFVTIWDDSSQSMINTTPEALVILEPLSAGTVFGSGLSYTREQQLERLAEAVAQNIEGWLRSDTSPIFGVHGEDFDEESLLSQEFISVGEEFESELLTESESGPQASGQSEETEQGPQDGEGQDGESESDPQASGQSEETEQGPQDGEGQDDETET